MIMKVQWVLACTAALFAAAPAAAAVTIRNVEIKNASFEANRFPDGEFGISNIVDWEITGTSASAGVTNPTTAMLANVPDGDNVALLNSYLYNGVEERSGAMGQTLSEAVRAGSLYSLTVDVGRRLDVASVGQWVAEIMAGNAIVASGTLTDGEITSGAFTPLTVSYTGTAATAGMQLGVRFRSIYDATSRQRLNQVNFDNVRMTAASDGEVGAVPEPGTWALMLAGFGFVGASLRHRRGTRALSMV
jgi:hypothetical protein